MRRTVNPRESRLKTRRSGRSSGVHSMQRSTPSPNCTPIPPLQPHPRNPLVLRETDALTVKASTENREAVRLNFRQKSGVRPRGSQETFRGSRASRAAQRRTVRSRSTQPNNGRQSFPQAPAVGVAGAPGRCNTARVMSTTTCASLPLPRTTPSPSTIKL